MLHNLEFKPMGQTEISSLGKQIADRRKELNISQADLAEMSGVSLRTVNGIESGRANPSVRAGAQIRALKYFLNFCKFLDSLSL